MTTTRELLKAHTADLVRPRYENHQAAIAHLVTTVHDPDASDEQAEAAALAFLDDWGGHVTYRKTARYGLILWTMRHRDDTAHRVQAFNVHVQKLGHANMRGWYESYTSYGQSAAA